jgi:23S rRNA pseudouridine1911/1915/1917 synthase
MSTRSFLIDDRDAGRALGDWLRARLDLPADQVQQLLRLRRVLLAGAPCVDARRRLRPGQRVEVRLPSQRQPTQPTQPAGPAPVIRFTDEHVVVVDKPAGLTTVRNADEAAEFGERGRRFLPATLADLLPGLLAARRPGKPGKLRAVHRLDKETSGLVVFARTAEAERHLGRQFRAHTTERLYLAVVRGQARAGRIESWLVPDRGDGRRGSGPPGQGQHAVTHVQVAEALGPYTLVECRLETGRTHQVRIHLGEARTPLCGERVYDRPPQGRPLPDDSGAGRVMLHAAVLGFDHPATGERVRWTAPLPADMQDLVQRLRRQAPRVLPSRSPPSA